MSPDQKPTEPQQNDNDPAELKPFSYDNQSSSRPTSTELSPQAPIGDIDSQFDTPTEQPSVQSLGDTQSDQRPAPVPADAPQPHMFATAPHRSKKKIILITLAAALVVLGASSSVFAFWYNKPANVLDDMLRKVITTEQGTVDGFYESDNNEPDSLFKTHFDYQFAYDKASNASMSGKLAYDTTADGQKKSFDLNVSAVTSNDRKLYIKADPLQKIATELSGGTSTMFDSLIKMVDGKWVVVTPEDVQGDEKADKQSECATNALKAFTKDKKQVSQVSDIYKKHRFIAVSKDHGIVQLQGKLTNYYELKFDEAAAKGFADALVSTDVFKKVDACYDGELKKSYDEQKQQADTSSTDNSSKSQDKLELWVGAVSHMPVKTVATGTLDKQANVLETNYALGKQTTVTIPKADVTVDELKKEIDRIEQEYMQTYEPNNAGGLRDTVLGASTNVFERSLTRLLR